MSTQSSPTERDITMVAVAVAVLPKIQNPTPTLDMQVPSKDISAPAESNEAEYLREVLGLEDGAEEKGVDEKLLKAAQGLGIVVEPLVLRDAFGDGELDGGRCESAETVLSEHVRSTSSGSAETGVTSEDGSTMENKSTVGMAHLRRRPSARRSLSFGEYEKYLAQHDAGLGPLKAGMLAERAPSLFSVSTRRSYVSFKSGIRNRLGLRRKGSSLEDVNSCICCREDFKKRTELQTLPCAHNYCDACLHVLITQASTDESKMPPRCCTKAIPGSIIKSVLSKEEQHLFMKSVLQFSTPWESRIFCPNTACGEFIPKKGKIDPKHPFEVVCRRCRTRACSICKRSAHAFGQDCPSDWELDAVLRMGEKSGWRRCYKCRTLVELTQGCSHITCRCKAQFCYICGAVWDPVVGCPNYCNGEEELERRRLEEEARRAEEEAEKKRKEEEERREEEERVEAQKRTRECVELNALRARMINERDRFNSFERKMKWIMWTRHGQAKIDILDRYGDLQLKMKERHLRTAAHLEDRQVSAEMELRASLKQAERSVQIRLRHMEAYCDGLGRVADNANPARVVTERDLRELGQQYNIRDDLERLHQSKINVMRDRQAKQMEQLLCRQEEELDKLKARQSRELEELEDGFGKEEEALVKRFGERKERLKWRWGVEEEVERRKAEGKLGGKMARLEEVVWVDGKGMYQEALGVVNE